MNHDRVPPENGFRPYVAKWRKASPTEPLIYSTRTIVLLLLALVTVLAACTVLFVAPWRSAAPPIYLLFTGFLGATANSLFDDARHPANQQRRTVPVITAPRGSSRWRRIGLRADRVANEIAWKYKMPILVVCGVLATIFGLWAIRAPNATAVAICTWIAAIIPVIAILCDSDPAA